MHHITALRHELGALNMGSMNYAKYSKTRKELVFDFVFSNPSDITSLLVEHRGDRLAGALSIVKLTTLTVGHDIK